MQPDNEEIVVTGPTKGHESKSTDLFLVGAGVSFPGHLTVQTIEVLSACARICTNLNETECLRLPAELRGKCVSFSSLYQDKRNRSANYRDVAEAVIRVAERERPVAWMTPGHPIVFDSVSQALIEAGRARGWRVSPVPAISCFDTILAELGYDPARGLLVHEATSVVRLGMPLLPAYAALLLQPSVFGSDVAHTSMDWSPDLSPLRDYLLRFYTAEQDCGFIRSSSKPGGRSQVLWTKLRDLTSVPFQAVAGSTLFLPAAGKSRSPKEGMAGVQRSTARKRRAQEVSEGRPSEPQANMVASQVRLPTPTRTEAALAMQSLIPGIRTFFDPTLSLTDRFQVSSGTNLAAADRKYQRGAIIPRAAWRKPTAREAQILTAIGLPEQSGTAISVVSMPPFLIRPFLILSTAARKGQTEKQICEISCRQAFGKAIDAVIDHLHRHFGPGDGAQPVEEIMGGILANPPGQPATTKDPQSKELVGLHVDNWSQYPIERRALAPNRMTVNLGCQDRFLLFVNLPISEMYSRIRDLFPDEVSVADGYTAIARAFMMLFPSYPVVRLRIRPGEAYIAPTENVVHDGSTMAMTVADISLHLRGRIALMPNPTDRSRESDNRPPCDAHPKSVRRSQDDGRQFVRRRLDAAPMRPAQIEGSNNSG